MGHVVQKNSLVLLYSVFPKNFKVRQMAEELIKNKLIVCVNIFPKVESIYQWKGKVESSAEVPVIFKTTKKLKTQVMKQILSKHPYDVPVLVEIKTGALNLSYERFLVKELST